MDSGCRRRQGGGFAPVGWVIKVLFSRSIITTGGRIVPPPTLDGEPEEMAAAPPAASVTGEPQPSAFKPYISADQEPVELSFSAVLLGSVLGIIFGASSLYLFLKVGMTVSASIPVAVLAITIFRGLSRAFGTPASDDPREQHRPDSRLGGRVDRLRRRGGHARARCSWATSWSGPGSCSWPCWAACSAS